MRLRCRAEGLKTRTPSSKSRLLNSIFDTRGPKFLQGIGEAINYFFRLFGPFECSVTFLLNRCFYCVYNRLCTSAEKRQRE